MMSSVEETALETEVEPRILGELRIDAYTPDSDVSEDSEAPKCARICCGVFLGTLLTLSVLALIAFFLLIFAFSYTMLESGACQPEWIGIGHLCLGVASRNGSIYDAVGICKSAHAEVVDLGTVQFLIDTLSSFAPLADGDFLGIVRVGGSKIVCMEATASGPSATKCPGSTAILCQRTRPLGRPAEIIRKIRVFLQLESQDYYDQLHNLYPPYPLIKL